jgi:hypothetical protein
MAPSKPQSVEDRLRYFQSAYLEYLHDPKGLPRLAQDWPSLALEVELLQKNGCLSDSTRSMAIAVATNVSVLAQRAASVQRQADVEAEDLVTRLEHLTMRIKPNGMYETDSREAMLIK